MIAQLITPTHLAILLVVLLLLFGPRRLPQTGRALGAACANSPKQQPGHAAPKDELPCLDHYGGEHQPVRTTGSE